MKLVTHEAGRLLQASPTYRDLPPNRQATLAGDLVRIGVYLVEPEGMRASTLPGAVTATGGGIVKAVDFPAFVGDLIRGVFQAIVDASVRQMEAYAALLASVAQTVDAFAAAPVSDSRARDWLTATYPEYFELDESGALRLRCGVVVSEALPRLKRLPVEGSLRTLTGAAIADKLVPAARRRMAAGRQQLLAGMVLMGINRIVVTDGRITKKKGTSPAAGKTR